MDWDALKRVAYGPLNLMPADFWSLTFKELQELVEGYKLRNESEWEKYAQLASWITAPHLKRPISAKKLLGTGNEKRSKKDRRTTPEESKSVVQGLMQDMGIDK
jgi:hypothetical protein